MMIISLQSLPSTCCNFNILHNRFATFKMSHSTDRSQAGLVASTLQDQSLSADLPDPELPIVTWESPTKVVLIARSVRELAGADVIRGLEESGPERLLAGCLPKPLSSSPNLHVPSLSRPILRQSLKLAMRVSRLVKRPQVKPMGSYDVDGYPYHCYIDHPSNSGDESTVLRHLSSPLCKNCQKLFEHWEDIFKNGQGTFGHCKSKAALNYSAALGCSLCLQFLRNAAYEGRFTKDYFYDRLAEYDLEFESSDENASGHIFMYRRDSLSRHVCRYQGEEQWTVRLLFLQDDCAEVYEVTLYPAELNVPLACQLEHQHLTAHRFPILLVRFFYQQHKGSYASDKKVAPKLHGKPNSTQ
jgi:hypothetical protein